MGHSFVQNYNLVHLVGVLALMGYQNDCFLFQNAFDYVFKKQSGHSRINRREGVIQQVKVLSSTVEGPSETDPGLLPPRNINALFANFRKITIW